MKKKTILLGIILLIFPICNVKAACTDNEIVSFSKLAGNVIFTPIFKEDVGKFDIIVSNLNPNFYFIDAKNNKTYNYIASEIQIGEYIPNQSYRFKFNFANPACPGDNILSRYVTLPGYNPYYKDPVCKGLENYKVCQKWVNYTYSREKFVETVNQYKKENMNTSTKETTEVLGFYDHLIRFYEKYYFIILPIIIFSCIIVIVRRSKKDDLF